ncbi:peroxiredoxin-like family protein [uncultured Kriegella sp.]|uniref:peroxiredoxin-like family protein n=1 Tax=uncultured Kriegella sp. TaxID=1798910 RepID=UPI0030DCF076|tara:strand:+ start:395318 stop:395824 length:507 start_codon:yes stop_codon:yes gene_type:complete
MLKPKDKVPEIEVNLVNDTHWVLKDQKPEHFTMVIFYRGKHCPVCKTYLQELQKKISKFTERGVNVIAISSDTKEKAQASYDEWKVADIPIGYDFNIEAARKWRLFISKGIKDEPETFIEPGLFLIRPDNTLYSASIQSMPFARPEFDDLLKAIDYIVDKEYPPRGEA